MSRGRSRHHASRRRMYSARQRDLRERRLEVTRHGDQAMAEQLSPIEIEDASQAEVAVPITLPLRRGANAA